METNPIIKLSEIIQKYCKKNIKTRVVGKIGEPHCPTISVEIELPYGAIYQATGLNKKIAKQKAAMQVLEAIEYWKSMVGNSFITPQHAIIIFDN